MSRGSTWLAAAATLGTILACGDPPPEHESSPGMSRADYDGWRRPDALVAALGLSPGQTVADIGAGRGYLTGRLASAVGPGGRVVATDIDPEVLPDVAALAPSIEIRLVEPDRPGLEAARYDLVLLAEVDHLLPDRVDYLRRLRPALAPGGRIAVANRLQHRAGALDAARRAGYRAAPAKVDLPGQFLALLTPEVDRQ